MFKKQSLAIFSAIFFAIPANAQSLVGEGFNTAIEAVQDGIDLIWPDEFNIEGMSARMGFGIGVTPDYMGSDNYRMRIIPLIDIRYKDLVQLNGSRLSYAPIKHGNFSAGPLVNLRFGRDAGQNSNLEGFGDIGDTLELGAFVRYKTDLAMLSLEYRHGTGAGIGSSVLLTAGHGIYKNGRFSAMIAARARWMDNQTMQTNFGITDEQAAASVKGLPAFAASAGVGEANANLVGSFELNEKVRFLSLVSFGKLFGDAANSPLVRDGAGSSTQLITGVGLAIAF